MDSNTALLQVSSNDWTGTWNAHSSGSTQQPLVLLLNDSIAGTGTLFQRVSIKQCQLAAAVPDSALLLQMADGQTHGGAPGAKHIPNKAER
jgi:hypothetical protein